MRTLWFAWAGSGVVLLALFILAGFGVTGSPLGVLVDARGRCSLTRLQLTLWTLAILPVISGVSVSRCFVKGVDPLAFDIPAQVLGMLGIAVGSAALSTGIKAHKDATRPAFIAVSRPGAESLAQMVLVEEGARADTTVDITKLQQLAITVFLVLAYVAICVHEFAGYGTGNPVTSPGDITSLPNFNSTFLTLLALSHAGYLAGKVPNRGALGQPGTVPGYSLANRSRDDSVSAGLDRAGLVAHRNAARKAEQQQALAKQQALADQRSSAPVPGSPSGNGPTSAGSPSGAHAYISPSDPH